MISVVLQKEYLAQKASFIAFGRTNLSVFSSVLWPTEKHLN